MVLYQCIQYWLNTKTGNTKTDKIQETNKTQKTDNTQNWPNTKTDKKTKIDKTQNWDKNKHWKIQKKQTKQTKRLIKHNNCFAGVEGMVLYYCIQYYLSSSWNLISAPVPGNVSLGET